MKKNAKQIVHELYNDISISKDPKYSDILEVLQKVYLKLEKQKYELDQSSPQSCVKVQPHQKHNVLRCEPNCHAFLSEERGQEQ
ncbi:hypothetical protein [Enterococcus faecium]|uniref:hypothetical protein n=1 Tax=Enterococcus faecium TaxID=1352 RepID=UPI0034E96A9B